MCYHCGSPIARGSGIARTAVCEGCGRDLHVCRNCRFYTPGVHWDCAETVDEQVVDKERSNFCDSFSVNPKFHEASTGEAGGRDKENRARERFSGLFKDE
jgi:hypothetical protein